MEDCESDFRSISRELAETLVDCIGIQAIVDGRKPNLGKGEELFRSLEHDQVGIRNGVSNILQSMKVSAPSDRNVYAEKMGAHAFRLGEDIESEGASAFAHWAGILFIQSEMRAVLSVIAAKAAGEGDSRLTEIIRPLVDLCDVRVDQIHKAMCDAIGTPG